MVFRKRQILVVVLGVKQLLIDSILGERDMIDIMFPKLIFARRYRCHTPERTKCMYNMESFFQTDGFSGDSFAGGWNREILLPLDNMAAVPQTEVYVIT